MVEMCFCRVEGQLFKNKFEGWDDVLGVDYTRTADSVATRGVDVEIDMKTDLSALFMPRQPSMGNHEAVSRYCDLYPRSFRYLRTIIFSIYTKTSIITASNILWSCPFTKMKSTRVHKKTINLFIA